MVSLHLLPYTDHRCCECMVPILSRLQGDCYSEADATEALSGSGRTITLDYDYLSRFIDFLHVNEAEKYICVIMCFQLFFLFVV